MCSPVGGTDEGGFLGIQVGYVLLKMHRELVEAPGVAREVEHQLQHIGLREAWRMVHHVRLAVGIVGCLQDMCQKA
jgi:hypothetical protein